VTTMTDERLKRIAARRAHQHTPECYGPYEPCGEHHVHTDTCGGRRLHCRLGFDADIADLVTEVQRLRSKAEEPAGEEAIW